YGVDSLMAVDLVHAMETSLGVNLTIADVFQSPTLGDLAERVFESLQARTIELSPPPQSQSQEAPLSHGQRALWFLHQLAPESAAYNITAAAVVHSPLDKPALEQA